MFRTSLQEKEGESESESENKEIESMLAKAKLIVMIGIGGSGMRGLAYLLMQEKKKIVGGDINYQQLKKEKSLEKFNIQAEETALIDKAVDLVIYSDSVRFDHPMRRRARQLGIKEMKYSEALGEYANRFSTIAVTGTHGKSSTAAMLAYIAERAGLPAKALIGASVPAWNDLNASAKGEKYFIVEADEYREHFLSLRPNYIVVTSIDFDHPDYFLSLAQVEEAFGKFLARLKDRGSVVTWREIIERHSKIDWPVGTIGINRKQCGQIECLIPGEHMQKNACLAVACVQLLGVSRHAALQALGSWTGLRRRFEVLGKYKGCIVVSDYGHHPKAIQEVLRAAREKYPNKIITAIIETHTTERMMTFGKEFHEAWQLADRVVIAPVYQPPGRSAQHEITPEAIREATGINKTGRERVEVMESYAGLSPTLDEISKQGGVIIGFSAGVLDAKLRDLVKSLVKNDKY